MGAEELIKRVAQLASGNKLEFTLYEFEDAYYELRRRYPPRDWMISTFARHPNIQHVEGESYVVVDEKGPYSKYHAIARRICGGKV